MINLTKKIAVISLGCDKNRVDTEKMLYNLSLAGHKITNDFADAEIIIVNTCAFIESARAEAIESILESSLYKKNKCQKLIVTGCLPQKYSKELLPELSEVDAFLGTGDYDKISSLIEELYSKEGAVKSEFKVQVDKNDVPNNINRFVTTSPHFAFLKISEGCDNRCTFCTIPSIRGKYTSRSLDSLLAEAASLVENGAKEIILVAQDVTRYGIDLYGEYKLVELIRRLSKLDLKWIRLMYCYPELVSDELISEIDSNPKVAKYIDIPLQHTDDGILKLMNRKSKNEDIKNLIKKLRACKNYISIRTTFITGFPGETDKCFESLCDFLKEHKLDNVGIFAYSREVDTPSAKLPDHVDEKIKLKRVEKLGKLHLKNRIALNQELIGKTVTVVYEDIDYDRNLFVGRTQYNAPDIDTLIYFSGKYAEAGEFYEVKITAADGYDLIGEML